MTQSILVLNGPNLNLLGLREPEIYGRDTLADVEFACRKQAEKLGLDVDFRQSNHEGQLIDWVQEARTRHDGVIVNPAGYTHTSVALLDALLACDRPVIEVHLSNIHRREPFRHHSYVSKAATGIIAGFGMRGYVMALDAMAAMLKAPGT